jgi:hypothetical protein
VLTSSFRDPGPVTMTHDLVPTRRWYTSKTGSDVTPRGYLYRPVLACSRCGLETVSPVPALLREELPSGDLMEEAGGPARCLAGFVPAHRDAALVTCDEAVVLGILSS